MSRQPDDHRDASGRNPPFEADPAETALDQAISRYSPEVAALARDVLVVLRRRLPGATQLVYDNYNALAIGFGANDRASEAVFSVALWPRWVSFFFLQGANLPDPAGVLRGTGRRVRHIILGSPQDLDRPEITALMAAALEQSSTPFPWKGAARVIIKSISAKQRPRRPTTQDPAP